MSSYAFSMKADTPRSRLYDCQVRAEHGQDDIPMRMLTLKSYFSPIGLEADLESPTSMRARLFDAGETFALISGLPWSVSTTDSDRDDIIDVLRMK